MTAPRSSPGCHRQPIMASARNTRPSMKRTSMSFWAPFDRHLESCLLGLGVTPPKMTDLGHTSAAAVRLPATDSPQFRSPRENLSSVSTFRRHAAHRGEPGAPAPWAHEVDGFRKVVLVTQGALSNHDFGELVAPALATLAGEPDLLVVVTAGGRASASIPGPSVRESNSAPTALHSSGHRGTGRRKFSSDVQLANRWPYHLRNGHII